MSDSIEMKQAKPSIIPSEYDYPDYSVNSYTGSVSVHDGSNDVGHDYDEQHGDVVRRPDVSYNRDYNNYRDSGIRRNYYSNR